MDNLCMDVILGLDFQKQHESMTLKLGGKKPALLICGLSSMSAEPPSLFSNLFVDCRLHLMELRSRLSIIGYWPFIRNHSAHHLFCVLYPSIDLVFAIEISMLVDIL